MSKYYIGEIGTVITMECTETITGATGTKMAVLKPDGTVAAWDASVEGTTQLKRVTEATDFSVAGKYYVQAYMTLGSWTGYGDTDTFEVYSLFG